LVKKSPSAKPQLHPRKVPQQARSRATWEAIVEAATQVFSSEGYDDGAVAQVAGVAGVSVGSLYQYFPTKEALIAAVRERASEALIRELEPRMIALTQLPLREGAFGLAKLLIETHQQHVPLMRALMNSPQPGSPAVSAAFLLRVRTAVQVYLQTHRAELRSQNLELSALLIVSALVPALRSLLLERAPHWTDQELAEELTQLLLGYILPNE
jgi:AcrR family transcriptional regulator